MSLSSFKCVTFFILFVSVVDGNFSSWSNFGACSKTCGPGIQSRTRSCTNPRPQFGGKECVGDILESRNCSFGKYPGKALHVIQNSVPLT